MAVRTSTHTQNQQTKAGLAARLRSKPEEAAAFALAFGVRMVQNRPAAVLMDSGTPAAFEMGSASAVLGSKDFPAVVRIQAAVAVPGSENFPAAVRMHAASHRANPAVASLEAIENDDCGRVWLRREDVGDRDLVRASLLRGKARCRLVCHRRVEAGYGGSVRREDAVPSGSLSVPGRQTQTQAFYAASHSRSHLDHPNDHRPSALASHLPIDVL